MTLRPEPTASHPFSREGLLERALPFLAVMAVAYATVPIGPHVDLHELAGAAALNVLIVAAMPLVPWSRLPHAASIGPALVYLGVVALLRESEGGAGAGFAPLSLLPVFWVALHGTRPELVACIAAVGLLFVVPAAVDGAPRYPASEWRRGILLMLVGGIVGIGIQRSERARARLLAYVSEQALTDELTGLPNRRAWNDELDRELGRSRRDARALCIAIVDFDDFKAFNDEFGHPAGDALLRRTAVAWRRALRRIDVLARYGGEEFAVLLPECELEEALVVLERLRAATPAQTVSAGLVECSPGDTGAELIERADAALYRAKQSGRDRIEVAAAR